MSPILKFFDDNQTCLTVVKFERLIADKLYLHRYLANFGAADLVGGSVPLPHRMKGGNNRKIDVDVDRYYKRLSGLLDQLNLSDLYH